MSSGKELALPRIGLYYFHVRYCPIFAEVLQFLVTPETMSPCWLIWPLTQFALQAGHPNISWKMAGISSSVITTGY